MREEILRACRRGDLKKVKFLVEEKGVSIDITDECQETLLMIACRTGNVQITGYLLDKGADINVYYAYESGKNPLTYACSKGDLELVKCLVERLKDINVKDYFRKSPLVRAFENGNLDIAEYLIEHGADISNIVEDMREDVTEEYPLIRCIKAIYEKDMGRLTDLKEFFEAYWRKYNIINVRTKSERVYERIIRSDAVNVFSKTLITLLPKLDEMKNEDMTKEEIDKIDSIRKEIVKFVKTGRREFENATIENIKIIGAKTDKEEIKNT